MIFEFLFLFLILLFFEELKTHFEDDFSVTVWETAFTDISLECLFYIF